MLGPRTSTVRRSHAVRSGGDPRARPTVPSRRLPRADPGDRGGHLSVTARATVPRLILIWRLAGVVRWWRAAAGGAVTTAESRGPCGGSTPSGSTRTWATPTPPMPTTRGCSRASASWASGTFATPRPTPTRCWTRASRRPAAGAQGHADRRSGRGSATPRYAAAHLMGNAIDAFEGPNELDNGCDPELGRDPRDFMPRTARRGISARRKRSCRPQLHRRLQPLRDPSGAARPVQRTPLCGRRPARAPPSRRALEGRAGAAGRAAVFTETGYHNALVRCRVPHPRISEQRPPSTCRGLWSRPSGQERAEHSSTSWPTGSPNPR